jgi:DNA-binding NtrC family response regulator
MKAKTDFLFCVTNKTVVENLDKVCSKAGFSFKIVDDFDRLLSAIESQHFSYIFVDLDDEGLKPLQTLDWLGTYFLYSKIGIFTSKAYKNEFLQALRLGVGFFVTQEQYENEEKLRLSLNDLIHLTDQGLPTLVSGEKGIGKEMVAKDLAKKAGYFVIQTNRAISDIDNPHLCQLVLDKMIIHYIVDTGFDTTKEYTNPDKGLAVRFKIEKNI